jgi:Tfp pilus assembly protein PilE
MRHTIVAVLSTAAIIGGFVATSIAYSQYQTKKNEEAARAKVVESLQLQKQQLDAERLKALRLKECIKQEAYWAALPQANRAKLEAPACRSLVE